jgi:hypothetical protein
MLVRLFTAPMPAVADQPYRPGFHIAIPAKDIASVNEDTTNRAWTEVYVAAANQTYTKFIVAMNFEQVTQAWERALMHTEQAKFAPQTPIPYYDPGQRSYEGVGIGSQTGTDLTIAGRAGASTDPNWPAEPIGSRG